MIGTTLQWKTIQLLFSIITFFSGFCPFRISRKWNHNKKISLWDYVESSMFLACNLYEVVLHRMHNAVLQCLYVYVCNIYIYTHVWVCAIWGTYKTNKKLPLNSVDSEVLTSRTTAAPVTIVSKCKMQRKYPWYVYVWCCNFNLS